jgi:hypothetical protein
MDKEEAMRALVMAISFFPLASILTGPIAVATADCPGTEVPVPAGVPDEFALPTEPTDPSPEYASYMDEFWPQPTTRWFDAGGNDEALIHTFGGWSGLGPVCGARLEIRLAGQSSGLSINDSVRLELVGGPDPVDAFQYWTTIANVTGSWGPGSVATLDLDLSDLPPYADYPTDILDALDDGSLDLAVEDDTAVDYAILHLCYCPPVSVESSSWGRVKASYVGDD